MSTLGRSGAGWAGASWASLAALRALPIKKGIKVQRLTSVAQCVFSSSLSYVQQEKNQGTATNECGTMRLQLLPDLCSTRKESRYSDKRAWHSASSAASWPMSSKKGIKIQKLTSVAQCIFSYSLTYAQQERNQSTVTNKCGTVHLQLLPEQWQWTKTQWPTNGSQCSLVTGLLSETLPTQMTVKDRVWCITKICVLKKWSQQVGCLLLEAVV